MATTVHEVPGIKAPESPGLRTSHDGGRRDRGSAQGSLHSVDDSSPASRTGVWVGLAAITMTFAAFTSAMIVREGASNDWRHFSLPPILFLNTVILLFSSATLEFARRNVAAYVHGNESQRSAGARWLWITLGLGLLFVGGQWIAWSQLRAEGVYLASNPSSSFFYLFTVVHVVHVVGGLFGLTLVIRRFAGQAPTLRISTLSTVAYYWHFMGALWIYLLLLLWSRI